jgi:hypothetical protein
LTLQSDEAVSGRPTFIMMVERIGLVWMGDYKNSPLGINISSSNRD